MTQHDGSIPTSSASRAAFDELSRLHLDDESMQTVLQKVAELAKRTIPNVDESSVTMLQGDRAVTAVYTGLLAYELDETQYQRGEGPCMDAATSGAAIEVTDIRTETRWPEYTAIAAQKGALSSLSVPVPVRQQVPAALNLYSLRAHGFGAEARGLAGEFAAHAAIAVSNMYAFDTSRKTALQLQQAMASRAVIDQAKGIIMAERRIDADQAFQVLAQASQRANRKLRDIAQEIVDAVHP